MIAMARVFLIISLIILGCFSANRELFFKRHLDVNGDGILQREEIRNYYCRTHGKNKDCHVSVKQLDYVLQRLDIDGSGYVSFDEFKRRTGPTDPIEGAPQQVHLSVTDKQDEMVVMWVTRDKYQDFYVKYGRKSNNYNESATGIVFTYDVGVFGWKGWIYQVVLKGLLTNTRYYYRVGSDDNLSDEFTFLTPPSVNDEEQFKNNVFAFVADMGTTIPMGWAVTDQIVSDNRETPFSLILHAGDVCYAGTGDEWEFEEIWDEWGDQVQPIAGYVPYMFAVGNHEHYYNYTSYSTRFLMPGAQCGGWQNFWYSIDYGNVHFTFMSTEHDYSVGSVQYNWIEQDFIKANQNRVLRPWLILLGHRPMYCSDTDEYNAGLRLRTILEPLMRKYKVDAYLCGHMHMYERIYPNYNGTVVATGNVYINPTAPAYVVQGTGGVFEDNKYIEPQPAWSAYRINYWGYAKITTNQSNLLYQFFNEETYGIVDEFSIIKN